MVYRQQQRGRAPIGALFVFLCASCGGGCAGDRAREEVLLPAIRLAWGSSEGGGVAKDVETGIKSGEAGGRLKPEIATALRAEATGLGAGIAQGGAAGMAAVKGLKGGGWAILKGEAETGIAWRLNKNEIGVGVAGSLRERLKNFTDALNSWLAGGGS